MRMSDLLACRVIEPDGHELGRVRDVRLVMEGAPRGSLSPMRVDALVVGSAAGSRLGYGSGVRAPVLLRWIAERLARRTVEIPADEIATWDLDEGRLYLATR